MNESLEPQTERETRIAEQAWNEGYDAANHDWEEATDRKGQTAAELRQAYEKDPEITRKYYTLNPYRMKEKES